MGLNYSRQAAGCRAFLALLAFFEKTSWDEMHCRCYCIFSSSDLLFPPMTRLPLCLRASRGRFFRSVSSALISGKPCFFRCRRCPGSPESPLLAFWGGMSRDHGDDGDLFPWSVFDFPSVFLRVLCIANNQIRAMPRRIFARYLRLYGSSKLLCVFRVEVLTLTVDSCFWVFSMSPRLRRRFVSRCPVPMSRCPDSDPRPSAQSAASFCSFPISSVFLRVLCIANNQIRVIPRRILFGKSSALRVLRSFSVSSVLRF
jgi:hypothetical protein